MSTLYSARGKMFAVNGQVLRMPDHRAPFVIKVDTTLPTSSNTFILPLSNHVTNLVVECCDGQEKYITNYQNSTITFATPGVYTLKLRGECGWSFANTGDCKKVTEIISWGDMKFNYLLNGFYGCINLTSLPATGSINGPTILSSSYSRLFSNCTSLTSFGSPDIFDRSGNIVGASLMFNQCSNLAGAVPAGYFDGLVLNTSFQQTFNACPKITTLPADLFKYNIKVTSFLSCFQGCSLLNNLPSDLFKYNTLVTSFVSTFNTCSALSSLPVDLFRYNTAVTSFASTFLSCSSLTTLPTDLFRYNTLVTSFGGSTLDGTFQGCTALTALPTDIFRYNTAVTAFSATFQLCGSLNNIPTDLFRYNVNVTNFSSLFNRCTSLSSIPVDTFRYNTAVTTFNGAFVNCALTSLPNNLFYYNSNVTNYGGAFSGNRTQCALPVTLFNLANINKVTVWTTMFNVTTANTFTGTVQDIWNYASAGSTKTDCFQGCTGLSNYASIPVEWT